MKKSNTTDWTLEIVKSLAAQFPNDADLGAQIRRFIKEHKVK